MIVVDANVIVELTTPGPQTETAEALRDVDPFWVAPVLWRSEFVSAVWQKLRAGKIDHRTTAEVLALAEAVVTRTLSIDFHQVLDLAVDSNHPPYDCEYVLLARSLETKLCTLDQQVLERFPDVARTPKRLLDEIRADS